MQQRVATAGLARPPLVPPPPLLTRSPSAPPKAHTLRMYNCVPPAVLYCMQKLELEMSTMQAEVPQLQQQAEALQARGKRGW